MIADTVYLGKCEPIVFAIHTCTPHICCSLCTLHMRPYVLFVWAFQCVYLFDYYVHLFQNTWCEKKTALTSIDCTDDRMFWSGILQTIAHTHEHTKYIHTFHCDKSYRNKAESAKSTVFALCICFIARKIWFCSKLTDGDICCKLAASWYAAHQQSNDLLRLQITHASNAHTKILLVLIFGESLVAIDLFLFGAQMNRVWVRYFATAHVYDNNE